MSIVHYTPEQDEIIRTMVEEGKSADAAGKVIGRSQSAMVRRAHKIGIAFHAKGGPPKSNVVKFPKRKYVRKPQAADIAIAAAPKLRVVSNNVPMMVADWIAKNGIRRFERGFSTDYSYLKDYLEKHGISLKMVRNDVFISKGAGRPKKVGWSKVWQMVDEFRLAAGLEPILLEGRRA